MNTPKVLDKAAAIREYEAQCNGTNDLYKHQLGIYYSDGMKFVAETCGAYWLLDLIASHQPAIQRKLTRLGERDFQVWRLEFEPTAGPVHGWTIRAWTDKPHAEGSRSLATQHIEFSDFPRELSPFEFWVENRTAMLKPER